MVAAASTGGAPPMDYLDDLSHLTPRAQNPVLSGGHYWTPKGGQDWMPIDNHAPDRFNEAGALLPRKAVTA